MRRVLPSSPTSECPGQPISSTTVLSHSEFPSLIAIAAFDRFRLVNLQVHSHVLVGIATAQQL